MQFDINYFSDIKAKVKELIGIDLIYCPAGKYIMGSPENESGRKQSWIDEKQHEVVIEFPFLLGKFTVTSIQFAYVMLKNRSWLRGSLDPEIDSAYPAMSVNWLESKKFCDKLNEEFAESLPRGYIFNLPTSEQWEYACRAGTNSALNNGKELTSEKEKCVNLDEVAWYGDNSEDILKPVGFKKPNSWGFYDMHGNIREWCLDICDDDKGRDRIMRNSPFWSKWLGQFRSAYSEKTDPWDFDYDGFRLALSFCEPKNKQSCFYLFV